MDKTDCYRKAYWDPTKQRFIFIKYPLYPDKNKTNKPTNK